MKCSVFIATSADGYIATTNGSVDWLQTAGNSESNMGDHSDMGFNQFLNSIDCIIMGRKCMEVISKMNLTPEQWPYGKKAIIVLSKSLQQPPENLRDKVEIYSGDIAVLLERLAAEGHKQAYIDGGQTITTFINLRLIDEMTITKAPILLGAGIPLFGRINQSIQLKHAEAKVYDNDFIQIKYKLNYTTL